MLSSLFLPVCSLYLSLVPLRPVAASTKHHREMSAPSTPTADAGKDAWNSYNARVQARLGEEWQLRDAGASDLEENFENTLSHSHPTPSLFKTHSRSKTGRDREAEAARQGEQDPQKDLKDHPGVVARQRRRFLVVVGVKGQVQARAPGLRVLRRHGRVWRWRCWELCCLCCCWSSRGRKEGIMRKRGKEEKRKSKKRPEGLSSGASSGLSAETRPLHVSSLRRGACALSLPLSLKNE